jgi:hypothetical protein
MEQAARPPAYPSQRVQTPQLQDVCGPAILIAAVVDETAVVDENVVGSGDVVFTVVRERPQRCVARGPRVPVDCCYERAGLYPLAEDPPDLYRSRRGGGAQLQMAPGKAPAPTAMGR